MDSIAYSKQIAVNVILISFRTNGKDLFVGITENYEEAKKIREGAVITVKYIGANIYGTLQYPKFYRERTDVSWDDIVIQT
jgi:hypothetical protein